MINGKDDMSQLNLIFTYGGPSWNTPPEIEMLKNRNITCVPEEIPKVGDYLAFPDLQRISYEKTKDCVRGAYNFVLKVVDLENHGALGVLVKVDKYIPLSW